MCCIPIFWARSLPARIHLRTVSGSRPILSAASGTVNIVVGYYYILPGGTTGPIGTKNDLQATRYSVPTCTYPLSSGDAYPGERRCLSGARAYNGVARLDRAQVVTLFLICLSVVLFVFVLASLVAIPEAPISTHAGESGDGGWEYEIEDDATAGASASELTIC